ncbi:MAG: efflux RND transporter periplasmic adaptor subunit [Armatimonadota bacterium]
MTITNYINTRILLLALLAASFSIAPHKASAEDNHAHEETEKGHAHGDDEAHGKEGHEGKGHGEEEGHGEEGVLELSPEVLKTAGIQIDEARARSLSVTLSLTGKLLPNEDKVAHVVPRFPGIIREVKKRLGDTVNKGDVLAIVESNSTIQQYELRSLLSGVITKRHATLGEFASDSSELFVVSDYSELFADFFVYPTDASRVFVGQKAFVIIPGRDRSIESTVSFISPITDTDNQSRFVRVVVPNQQNELQPGSFVSAGIVTEEAAVSVSVLSSAVQNIEGKPRIFVQTEDHLKATPVMLGRSDLQFTEILSGVKAGEKYAAGNTFVLKAELGKSEAEHEH